ncbi:olfactory receptor 9K2-like [Monodelphis domestica]|nr:olfactory receptor 9K2-like [Monodelphis domestica]
MRIHFLTLTCTSQQVPAMGERGIKNHSEVTEFILVGFRVHPELQILLFFIFLLIYSMVLLGNIGMIILIVTASRLNTPMYFFLGNLSLIDLSYSSVVAPKAIANLLSESKTISFVGCVAQLFFFALFIVTEGFLLAAMAYDRFIAICSPLLYSVRMSRRLCIQLVAGSYFFGCISSIIQAIITFTMSFCASHVIDFFYCDTRAIQKIACSNVFINEVISYTLAVLIILPTIIVIMVSYIYILSTILKMHSNEGQMKAFSTCGSHLMVVSLLYGTVSFMYLTPASNPELGKAASLCYTLVTPMLNPLIYSLRNKDVKEALKSMLWRKKSFL